jgi:DNA-binding transcriptional regulator YiaG
MHMTATMLRIVGLIVTRNTQVTAFGHYALLMIRYLKQGLELTIKQLRMALGMSAREFGVSCGLTGENIARTVYRWEAGDQEPNGACRMLMSR